MDEFIRIRGAKEHNLKNISVDIPRNKLVVMTGLSGSGKSSLAFDTLYAEGQRRYVESLSAYARQFLQMQDKPDVESISGLSPAIAIDQKTTSKNPRSTVGTITEIYDYLRLLYARIGVPYSPATGLPIQKQTVTQMCDAILSLPEGTKLHMLSPIVRGAKGEYRKELQNLRKQGYERVKIDGIIYMLDEVPALDKQKKHDLSVIVDRLVVGPDLGNRLADSVETALKLSEGLMAIEVVAYPEDAEGPLEIGEEKLYSEQFACPVSGFQLTEIEPRLFSFNSPFGACQVCEGLGIEKFFDPELIIPNQRLSLREGAIQAWSHFPSHKIDSIFTGLAEHYGFSVHTPFAELSEIARDIILHGSGADKIAPADQEPTKAKSFEGVLPYLEKQWRQTPGMSMREELEKYQSKRPCRSCSGFRLRQESLCVRIGERHIGEVSQLSIAHSLVWFAELPARLNNTQQKIAERVLKEISERLKFLANVGLDYLTLARESGTLSGGESQRIRLASQIGSGLSGVLYVLDEPSIGLHQSDNRRLITTLQHLRDLGNTVVVVEHDEETMMTADHLIDIGLGAGVHGGRIIAQGTPTEVMQVSESITGQYLSGARSIAVPKTRRQGHIGKSIELKGATANNLHDVDISIPLGTFTCVTGVSGGGKSSLIIHTLYKAAMKAIEGTKATPGPYASLKGLEYIDKIIEIDQSPIGRTPRSNPATYTGAFTPIRDWFVALPDSKMRGYKPGRFSFNVKGGRCEVCQGDGMLKIEMHFLPDVYVVCDECKGKRYNRETLEIKYKDKSISDVLEMTVEEALPFFEKMPTIRDKMKALLEVGLGYIQIGQSATTLSGGEAQRVKLAKELSKRSTGRTLYILDEPTTGLHSEDIRRLLIVLQHLVELGNTVLVIEHNMDVIKTADYILDIGPGGGDQGGRLVGFGTPEQLAKTKDSITGQFLGRYLEK